jgi:hypothetical protein
VTAFSALETPSNVADVAAPMHMAQQRYFVRQRRWSDQKGQIHKYF